PPVSAHQCQLSVLLSVPVSATYQCQSVPHISVHQCHLLVPVSAAYQCCLTVSVPPNSANMRSAFQCPSVMPANAHQCHLPMPPHQCSLSVPITAASLAHIS
ncbi:unnamed protein product, partial [Staurois parvus]